MCCQLLCPLSGLSVCRCQLSGVVRVGPTQPHQPHPENIDNNLPSGKDWHVALLEQMSNEIVNIRPAVISAEFAIQLDEYMRIQA